MALPSSGTTGEGSRIRIRGNASLSQSNEPIVYVDGVRIDNGGSFGRGFVASLARPGGNITGISLLAVALTGKWLEIVKEVAPRVSRVAILRNAANPTHALFWAEAQAAGRLS